ncbi:DUF4386 domain-containing protein [Wenxinia marina]|uniref:DUF4386 domain-containing protein n=1 Tax=Wenxinia marina DSM 24838 TaxID=1123501 RepID=A0A0D0QDT2_9RHOB|nr:DUF4386 domain-containing protein [Wenxinia marina]KIQ69158.1 hypothetical protein Wenmar_02228 [Wenxinia marina DSM 24838]GGL70808.1 hypothetical protein GCM10011392_26680 [Wenxinia marina]
MTRPSPFAPLTARRAGLLYLVIIVCGLSAELALRGPLVDLADAAGTADAIRAAPGLFRLAIGADIVMALADAALALLLYRLLKPVDAGLALAAMVFRLLQSGLIASGLMFQQAAWLALSGTQDLSGLAPGQAEALAALMLNLHAHGYDLGLVFFGVNSVLTGLLLWRSGFAPRPLGAGLALAGAVYLTGSALRFAAPAAFEAFAPAYGITILAEGAVCLWLLLAGRLIRLRPAGA